MAPPLYFVLFLILLSPVISNHEVEIVIVGAGAAGIACATKLYQNGFKNLTILEAEDRIGGRIYSYRFDETYIDLGAQWCHGQKNNVVYKLVKGLNVLKTDNMDGPIYHSSRKLLDYKFSDKLYKVYETVKESDESAEHQGSLGHYLTEKYNDTIHKTWKNDNEKITLAEECFDLFRKSMEAYEGAFSWYDVADSSTFKESEGDQDLGWNGLGYKTILDVLMQKFPKSKIPIPLDDQFFLNKTVQNIVWDSPNKTEIKCTDGTIYTSDHVIWTPSLGVLKHGHKTLFTPQLPTGKKSAIRSLGFDAVLKIIFHFPEKWWYDEVNAFELAWAPDDAKKSGKAFSEGPQKNGTSWVTSLISILALPYHPNLLSVWFSGDFIPEIEKLSDETITNGLMYTLKRFLGDDYHNISRPDRVIRKNWYTDDHFRGTYSYETVKSSGMKISQMKVLSKPLPANGKKPVLLFAGEATNPLHYSTVHGAIESGFREAERLIRYYKQS